MAAQPAVPQPDPLSLIPSTADPDRRDLAAALFGAALPGELEGLTPDDAARIVDYVREAAATRAAGEPVVRLTPLEGAPGRRRMALDDPRARLAVIAGRPGAGLVDRGATVCSCFGIGANQIAAAVGQGCTTVAAIGEALRAGTNCGSCRSEIGRIIDAHRLEAAE